MNTDAPILFAVGDGNHSLNTAKFVWDKVKANLSGINYLVHPARYALVELVNIYDESIKFNPIHRILTNVDIEVLKQASQKFYPSAEMIHFNTYDDMLFSSEQLRSKTHAHIIPFMGSGQYCALKIADFSLDNEYDTLMRFLDHFLGKHKGNLDFVFSKDELKSLTKKTEDSVGFVMPTL